MVRRTTGSVYGSDAGETTSETGRRDMAHMDEKAASVLFDKHPSIERWELYMLEEGEGRTPKVLLVALGLNLVDDDGTPAAVVDQVSERLRAPPAFFEARRTVRMLSVAVRVGKLACGGGVS